MCMYFRVYRHPACYAIFRTMHARVGQRYFITGSGSASVIAAFLQVRGFHEAVDNLNVGHSPSPYRSSAARDNEFTPHPFIAAGLSATPVFGVGHQTSIGCGKRPRRQFYGQSLRELRWASPRSSSSSLDKYCRSSPPHRCSFQSMYVSKLPATTLIWDHLPWIFFLGYPSLSNASNPDLVHGRL